jgi:lipopolysaccharide heptosyltransferase II
VAFTKAGKSYFCQELKIYPLTSIKRITIFRLSSIGDIILTSPLVRCVKNGFPDAEITFVVKKEFADLVKYNPNISKVIEFDKKSGFKGLMQLRKEIGTIRVDWFIDIHNNLRSNVIKRFNGIGFMTRYHKKIWKRSLLVYLNINLYKNQPPIIERFFAAVKQFDIKYDGKGTEVFFRDKEASKIDALLSEKGMHNKPFAVLCPGASFTNKQWALDRFAEVALYLKNAMGYEVVLLGGPADRDDCATLQRVAGQDFLNVAGQLRLLESAALLQRCALAITNDSGMMHMAQSQGRPVVAIFGPTTRELGYFPMPQNSHVVEVDLPCRPCTHTGLDHCPKKHFNCMNHINSQMVIQGINKQLKPHSQRT